MVAAPARPAALPAAASAPAPRPWREFWAFTWPRAVNSLAALALQRLDILLVTVLAGPAAAAVYTAATRFLVVGQLVNASISTAAQPRLAEVLAVDDRASARSVYRSATAWIVLLTWPLYLVCAVFAESVLSIFGDGYDAGRPVIWSWPARCCSPPPAAWSTCCSTWPGARPGRWSTRWSRSRSWSAWTCC